MARTLLQCRCLREEPTVNREDATGRALELASSATPATARPRTALAAVARPAAEVAGLLLEVVRTLEVARDWPADGEQRPGSKGQQR
jgi:hypothetical protein